MEQEVKKLMATYVKHPPKKMQTFGHSGPPTLSNCQRFQWVRDQLAKEGVGIAATGLRGPPNLSEPRRRGSIRPAALSR